MNNELFEQVGSMVEPIVASEAIRFARKLEMTVDDAKQEARIALMLGLQRYDYNASNGGIFNFAKTVIRNYFLKMLHAHRAQMRKPHIVYQEDGQRKVLKSDAESLATITAADFLELCRATTLTPEDQLQASDYETRLRELHLRLLQNLGARERLVFECRTKPPTGLVMLMFDEGENEPTIPLIGRHLGLSKNAVDWSLSKIRRQFVSLVESDDFSDIAERLVVRGHWPMIHATQGESEDFVRRIIEDRRLDPEPTEDRIVAVGNHGRRVIERYPWGAAVFLRFETDQRTVVVEGRFNEHKGTLHSDIGAWKSIEEVVPWYRKLNTGIRA